MAAYRVNLVGPFGLYSPARERMPITSKKGIALLALLITAPNGARSRRWLEGMLWGSRGQEQAQASLRRELSTLGLQLAAAGAETLLLRDNQCVTVALEKLEVDLFALAVNQTGRRPTSSDVFLEGLDLRDCEEFEDWLREERARVRAMIELEREAIVTDLPGAHEILGMSLPGTQEIIANTPPRLPPKPSLAVLPFETMGRDADEWLGAGLADEIGGILSQFPQLFIVSSAAARAVASQEPAFAAIGVTLGVRYLITGTATVSGQRLRASVQLIDSGVGEQVWAQTFLGRLDDVFELQKDIAVAIAPQIWTMVDTAERRRVLRAVGPASGNYAMYWRANALFRSWERDSVREAAALTQELVTSDPTCPWAHSLAAYCHSIDYMMAYSEPREAARTHAVFHYQNAIRYGEDNVEALGYAAGTLINIGGDTAMADRLIAHALKLLPAHQPTLFWGGWVDLVRGVPMRARERFELALRINPASGVRPQSICGIGFACLLQGQFEEAYELLEEASELAPGFFLCAIGLTVAAVATGRGEQARTLASGLSGAHAEGILDLFNDSQHRALLGEALAVARPPKNGI